MNKTKKLYPFKFEQQTTVLDENSVIANGFLAENSIDDIIDTYLEDFLGSKVFQYSGGTFPVKVSHVNNNGELPLQAHPDNNTAMERYESCGKAKMWYITNAAPGSRIYLGFNRDMDATSFYNGCLDGSIKKDLYSFEPKAGDCIYIAPGCVHAAEGGFKYIEIAQNSQVTYHLNNDMEIAEAIDVIDYNAIDPTAYIFENVRGNITIVNSSNFIVKSIELQGNGNHSAQSYAAGSFKAYICLAGAAKLIAEGKEYEAVAGEFIVVPCGVEEYEITSAENSSVHLLEITMPELSEAEEDLYLNYDEDESNYPTGSGTDPEEDECDCDDDCDCEEGHHHCNCGHEHHHSKEEHHHHCGCDAHHSAAESGYVYKNPFEAEDDSEEDEHIGKRFFK